MSDDKAYAATPFDELERQIMDVNFAKNEREWWAWREICDLRAENEKLRAIVKEAYDFGTCKLMWDEIERERAAAMGNPITEQLQTDSAAALKETGNE